MCIETTVITCFVVTNERTDPTRNNQMNEDRKEKTKEWGYVI